MSDRRRDILSMIIVFRQQSSPSPLRDVGRAIAEVTLTMPDMNGLRCAVDDIDLTDIIATSNWKGC